MPQQRDRILLDGLGGVGKGKYTTNFNLINPPSISTLSDHAIKRASERGVSIQALDDALTNPLSVGKVKVDDKGRNSVRVVGESAEVVYNPDTGVIISVNPTHKKKAKKLKDGKNGI